jgi:arsenate reductase
VAVATDEGVEFDEVRYLKTPPDRATLTQLLEILDDPPADLVRHDANFTKLGLDPDGYTTAEAVIDLLVEHPRLMQRPVIVKGGSAIIGRPKDRVKPFLTG